MKFYNTDLTDYFIIYLIVLFLAYALTKSIYCNLIALIHHVFLLIKK